MNKEEDWIATCSCGINKVSGGNPYCDMCLIKQEEEKVVMKETENTIDVNWDSHLILYAKGHYKETDIIEDLKILVAKRSAIDIEYINENDIINVLLVMVEKYCGSRENSIYYFVGEISPNKYRYINTLFGDKDKWDFNIAVINTCLSSLRMIKCNDKGTVLLKLKEADENLLPLSDYTINRRREESK